MKKMLLCAALFAVAASANADVIVDKEQDFQGLDKFPFFVMGYEPEIVNGILTVPEYPGEWYQFFVIDGLTFNPEFEYTVTAKIKGSKAGELNVQLGNWGEGNLLSQTMTFTDQWAEQSVTFYGLPVDNGFSVFQPGTYDGSLQIEWVRVSHEGKAVVIPTSGNTILSYYTGNGETFGGWGAATFENVEEDGKPCLKFTNEAATDSWAIQMAINYDFVPGTTYYIGFDIKGTAAKGIPSGFQCQRNWAGCGDMNPFNITEDWQHVILFGAPKEVMDDEGLNAPQRWLASLGKYVGTFYMTNVTVYTESSSAVAGLEAEQKDNAVYNLMGVKVADKAQGLQNLPKGIYIVNGKKIMR